MELRPDTLVIPKADAFVVSMADLILGGFEKENGITEPSIGLVPLLETVAGILNAHEIINASPRVNGVQLGAEDLTKELGIGRTAQGEEIVFARTKLVYAACVTGVDRFDTPFTGIHDIVGLEADARKALSIGFTGKTCIHPSHIDVINSTFGVSDEEKEHARKLLEAFDEAILQGKGACMFEGKMIDAPIAERAKKLLAR
jgi:citrate lyase subunit beta/citryl-CoA lyase